MIQADVLVCVFAHSYLLSLSSEKWSEMLICFVANAGLTPPSWHIDIRPNDILIGLLNLNMFSIYLFCHGVQVLYLAVSAVNLQEDLIIQKHLRQKRLDHL